MSDYLLLGGVALCAVSIVLAVIQLLRTEPPRAAVITLIVGIVLIFAGAYCNPDPFQPQDILSAWARITAEATGTAP
ncbi:hypothetical protein [Paracoccus seriniphilus]|uniref:Uncharacterized protein n=1 Tax=Paracoccus seriniphilus TaxID=184748 RepID=A0A239PWZ5_9RHOB|nr:hypothetical protein [Paracoccus seriniphilus]WCR13306.1 hypothetical protein JHW44_10220 [Paracoccus seriniphilus]SNT74456.1 hypothetical protein SAMN05444959_107173 [Paracoccus seriniphilus]